MSLVRATVADPKQPADSKTTTIPNIPFNSFKVLKKIGRGAYGTVLKCRYKTTYQKVAIKLFDSKNKDEFDRELAALTELDKDQSKKFLKLHGYGEGATDAKRFIQPTPSSYFYIVMEYMAEGSLYDFLTNPRVTRSWKQKAEIAGQVAEQIVGMHSHQITHRDIRSANILLRMPLEVKISDFDTANSDECMTGTSYFQAPEVVLDDDDKSEPQQSVDTYSFGMTLIEIMDMQSFRKNILNVPYLTFRLQYAIPRKALSSPNTLLIEKTIDGMSRDEDCPVAEFVEVKDIIKSCVKHKAADRSSMATVLTRLKTLGKKTEDIKKDSKEKVSEQKLDAVPYDIAIRVSQEFIDRLIDSFDKRIMIHPALAGVTPVPVVFKTLRHFEHQVSDDKFEAQKTLLGEMCVLKHPNVVTVHAYLNLMIRKSTAILPAVISEFVEKYSLDCLFEKEKLSWNLIIQLLLEVLNGLEWFHTNNIVHGCLDSSRVLITRDNHAKLSFGFSYHLKRILSPYFLAPEYCPLQHSASEAELATRVSTASDIYSFGWLMLELLDKDMVDSVETDITSVEFIDEYLSDLKNNKLINLIQATIAEAHFAERCDPGQLKAFKALVLACLDVDPKKRPDIAVLKEALKKLTLSAGVSKSEGTALVALNTFQSAAVDTIAVAPVSSANTAAATNVASL